MKTLSEIIVIALLTLLIVGALFVGLTNATTIQGRVKDEYGRGVSGVVIRTQAVACNEDPMYLLEFYARSNNFGYYQQVIPSECRGYSVRPLPHRRFSAFTPPIYWFGFTTEADREHLDVNFIAVR